MQTAPVSWFPCMFCCTFSTLHILKMHNTVRQTILMNILVGDYLELGNALCGISEHTLYKAGPLLLTLIQDLQVRELSEGSKHPSCQYS